MKKDMFVPPTSGKSMMSPTSLCDDGPKTGKFDSKKAEERGSIVSTTSKSCTMEEKTQKKRGEERESAMQESAALTKKKTECSDYLSSVCPQSYSQI